MQRHFELSHNLWEFQIEFPRKSCVEDLFTIQILGRTYHLIVVLKFQYKARLLKYSTLASWVILDNNGMSHTRAKQIYTFLENIDLYCINKIRPFYHNKYLCKNRNIKRNIQIRLSSIVLTLSPESIETSNSPCK